MEVTLSLYFKFEHKIAKTSSNSIKLSHFVYFIEHFLPKHQFFLGGLTFDVVLTEFNV